MIPQFIGMRDQMLDSLGTLIPAAELERSYGGFKGKVFFPETKETISILLHPDRCELSHSAPASKTDEYDPFADDHETVNVGRVFCSADFSEVVDGLDRVFALRELKAERIELTARIAEIEEAISGAE
ncbi:hypothetical protein EON81_09995 [bacterium]|nr:MAG: hypothetical protein EON81_09995 [bacterium]